MKLPANRDFLLPIPAAFPSVAGALRALCGGQWVTQDRLRVGCPPAPTPTPPTRGTSAHGVCTSLGVSDTVAKGPRPGVTRPAHGDRLHAPIQVTLCVGGKESARDSQSPKNNMEKMFQRRAHMRDPCKPPSLK